MTSAVPPDHQASTAETSAATSSSGEGPQVAALPRSGEPAASGRPGEDSTSRVLIEPEGSGGASVWLWPALGIAAVSIAGAVGGVLASVTLVAALVAVAAALILRAVLDASWRRASGGLAVLVGLTVLGTSLAVVSWRASQQLGETVPTPRQSASAARGGNIAPAATNVVALRGADLHGADLSGADLRGADLTGARASGIDLHDADLTGATLVGAELRGADLRGACLVRVDLSGADLTGVRAFGATLDQTIVTPEQVEAAASWPTGSGAPGVNCT